MKIFALRIQDFLKSFRHWKCVVFWKRSRDSINLMPLESYPLCDFRKPKEDLFNVVIKASFDFSYGKLDGVIFVLQLSRILLDKPLVLIDADI